MTGASGGVGSAAVQLATAKGADVIAVTSQSKAQAMLDLGAAKVVERGESLVQVLGKNSVDVVVDLVAGDQWPEFLEVLRPRGRYAVAEHPVFKRLEFFSGVRSLSRKFFRISSNALKTGTFNSSLLRYFP